MRLRFTEQARHDFNNLIDNVAEQDLQRAEGINRDLRAALRSLAAAPLRSPAVGGAHLSEIRKRRCPPYVVLVKVRSSDVLVLRIAHERSDWVSIV